MVGSIANENSKSMLANPIPTNSVAKLPRLRRKTRRRNRAGKPMRSGKGRPRLTPPLLVSWRRKASGVWRILRTRPISVTTTSTATGTAVVSANTPQLQVA